MNSFKFNIIRVGLVFLVLVCSFARANDTKTESFFDFKELPPLGVNVEKAFVGNAGDNTLVIGGNTQQVASYTVYILSDQDKQWSEISMLEHHVYGGAAVGTHNGLICIGGYEDGQLSTKVMRFSVKNNKLETERLCQLPVGLSNAKAAVVSNQLYVVSTEGLFCLDLLNSQSLWQQLPGPIASNDCIVSAVSVGGNLYVFAQQKSIDGNKFYNVLRLSKDKELEKVGSTDYDLSQFLSAACGQAHALFVSKSGNNDILAYHTITDKWFIIGQLPDTIKPIAIASDDVKFQLIGKDASLLVEAITPATNYGWIDHTVVAAFMIGMLLVGTYLSRRERNSEDYFRGGQRVPWWASGLSLFATGASAISLMAMPGKSFADNWVFMTFSFYTIITLLPLSIFVYMPIARRLKVATANEYLERRFNIVLRMGGSIIWSLLQIVGRMAAIMLLPAIAISSITGISIEISIIIMGVVTTAYVYLGGLEGVIWTDVLQAIVMILAVVICAVWALGSLSMSTNEAWSSLQTAQKLHMFDWRVSLVEPCVMIIFLNIFITSLGTIGDQNFIQRVQCTPNEKEARKAVIMQVAVAVPMNAILFGLGTILFLFYMEKPDMLSPAIKSDGVFPLFAAQNLPSGLAGLVIAAILAATMSTLSSAMNSVANLGTEDFYRRFKKDATDHSCVVLGRVLTACLGIFGTLMALFLSQTDMMSIWDLYFVILGMLLGAITGIYTLGIFTIRGNSTGAFAGIISSLIVVFYIKDYTHIHFLAYPLFGVLTSFTVGYVVSLIVPEKTRNLSGLTIYALTPND